MARRKTHHKSDFSCIVYHQTGSITSCDFIQWTVVKHNNRIYNPSHMMNGKQTITKYHITGCLRKYSDITWVWYFYLEWKYTAVHFPKTFFTITRTNIFSWPCYISNRNLIIVLNQKYLWSLLRFCCVIMYVYKIPRLIYQMCLFKYCVLLKDLHNLNIANPPWQTQYFPNKMPVPQKKLSPLNFCIVTPTQ